MVEGAALEKRCGVKPTESSNLFLSAKKKDDHLIVFFLAHGEIRTLRRWLLPLLSKTIAYLHKIRLQRACGGSEITDKAMLARSGNIAHDSKKKNKFWCLARLGNEL